MVSLLMAHGAAAADALSVESIINKHIAAMGGKAALEKVNSRTMKFKMESDLMGPSEGQIFAQAPNKQRTQIDIAGTGSINEGFDGAVAWAKTPWDNLRVKAGEELAKVKRDAEFHRELKLKTLYPDLAFKGTEKVGNEEAYVLESKPSATSKERFSFSTKSGLLIRQESQFEGPQGAMNIQVLAQDYKPFEGIQYPTHLKMKVNAAGQSFEFTMKVTEISQNVKIEAEKFAKPAA
jgi:zinc protease